MDNIKKIVLVVALVVVAVSVQAGIYKWTDDEGNVHYTQTPPPKDGNRATINTDNFSSVQTVKAQPIPKRASKPKKQKTKSSTKKEKSNKKEKRRSSGCRRR
jgi:hypothetical protein